MEGHTFEERDRRANTVLMAAAKLFAFSQQVNNTHAERIMLQKLSDKVRQAVESYEALFN